MKAKIKIDLRNGVFEAAGTSEFVETAYAKFHDSLKDGFDRLEPLKVSGQAKTPSPIPAVDTEGKKPRRTVKRPKPKAPVKEGGSSSIDMRSPNLDKNLDLSKLKEFCAPYALSNNAEKTLIFGMFFEESLSLEKANSDQYYSCFREMGFAVPEAFSQNFIKARGNRYGFIDYSNSEDISVTTKGRNFFLGDLKKAESE